MLPNATSRPVLRLAPFAVAAIVLLLLLLLVTAARAEAPTTSVKVRARPPETNLLGVEARVAGGVALGGGAGDTAVRAAPVTISVLAELAVVRDPLVSIFATAYVETLDRAGFGVGAGVRLRPYAGRLRVGLGFQSTVAPYIAAGPLAHVGGCYKIQGMVRFCADLEAVALVLGDDLPEGKVATQLQGVISVGFDAL